MSWTDPTTRATGDLITAAIYNADIINDIKFLVGLGGRINSDGTTAAGTGFSSSRSGAGRYTITFTSAFPAVPFVFAEPTANSSLSYSHDNVTTGGFTFAADAVSGGAATDVAFHFFARGIV